MPHSVPASAGAPARGESPTGSPRRLSTSLQAAATMNAGLQHEPSRRSSSGSLSRNRQSPGAGRRRSTVLMNLQLNDPSVPGPGEMVADSQHTQHNSGVNTASPQPMASSPLMVAGGDPHHNRAPSLGELHQELEAEQEAQVVVGGGAVGLATARALAQRPGTSTVVLERHGAVGTETSSRNSEVIHAGLYYGAGTLKTELCIRGKELLYAFCRERGVAHANTGKWIVAQTPAQREALQRVHDFCRNEIDVPIRWVGEEEARRLEPGVRGEAGILDSPTTGIVDSHGLMVGLMGLFEDVGGEVVLTSAVTGVTPLGEKGSQGWEVRVRDSTTGEESLVTAEVLVNAAGLGSVDLHNMIVPLERRRTLFYAKGNYFSYSSSKPKVGRLIYPAPEPGAGGLGTHLTLDLAGRVRFGPDVEWVDSPNELAVNVSRLPLAIEAIKKYLPELDESCLEPDYAGIRPKLGQLGAVAQGTGFHDFVVRKEEGYEGWVNLLGIESPGLTSCLAIAERVDKILYE
ncbi:L-2-hydroxyglutarate dehydrogenase [Colletotrichum sp. SAR 10_70]|nr:L-2-hydroxyglutarate dehydrogenase [Colletotrichum sp. SAR 10_71]KAI8168075.1 L-2-hydroxyglutarate dehydrogenase [Colletotrichum sp. SAR 10_70]